MKKILASLFILLSITVFSAEKIAIERVEVKEEKVLYFISRNFQLKWATLPIILTLSAQHHVFKHLPINNLELNTAKIHLKNITFQTLLLSYSPLI